MNAKQKLAAEFVELLKQQRKEHNERGRFLGYAERLAARIRLCGICGSWVGNGTTYSMLVSPQEDSLSVLNSLSVLICDNSHCYKTVWICRPCCVTDRLFWLESWDRAAEESYWMRTMCCIVPTMGRSFGRTRFYATNCTICKTTVFPKARHKGMEREVILKLCDAAMEILAALRRECVRPMSAD